jgi:hypothetical protein
MEIPSCLEIYAINMDAFFTIYASGTRLDCNATTISFFIQYFN